MLLLFTLNKINIKIIVIIFNKNKPLSPFHIIPHRNSIYPTSHPNMCLYFRPNGKLHHLRIQRHTRQIDLNFILQNTNYQLKIYFTHIYFIKNFNLLYLITFIMLMYLLLCNYFALIISVL